jgi:hypothetical protein
MSGIILNINMLSVIMLNVIMLSVVMLNVVMLNVVAPFGTLEISQLLMVVAPTNPKFANSYAYYFVSSLYYAFYMAKFATKQPYMFLIVFFKNTLSKVNK